LINVNEALRLLIKRFGLLLSNMVVDILRISCGIKVHLLDNRSLLIRTKHRVFLYNNLGCLL
jgi:hypothetical protein